MQLNSALALLLVALLAVAPLARAETPVTARTSVQSTFYADTDHVTVFSPVLTTEVADAAATWKVNGSYLVDVISAASVDIVSTASQRWEEVRHAASLGGSYAIGDLEAGVSGAFSLEPDYVSEAGGVVLTGRFGQNEHLAFAGYTADHDLIGRTGTPFDVFSHTLWQHDFVGGVTLTLNRSTVLSLMGDVIVQRGDPSKPYRYVPMFSAAVAPAIAAGASIDEVNARREPERPLEQLPTERERGALTVRLAHRLSSSTFRVDERLYSDTWQLHATTTEARYLWDVSRRLTLGPRLRLHAQTGTDFWRRAYVASTEGTQLELPRYRTGDRELGPLASVTGGASARVRLGSPGGTLGWWFDTHADVIHTRFFDTLYMTSRTAFVLGLGLSGELQ